MVVLKEVTNTNMFWALTLETGVRYTQTVEKAFHMSMAALEDPGKKKDGVVGVMISTEKAEFLLCSLSHRTPFNQPLDLNFTEGEEVTFFINGEGTVHLTGYQLEDEQNDFDDYNDMITDSDDDEDEAEVPTLIPVKGEKRKSQPTQDKAKKLKMERGKKEASLDSDDDDDDELLDDDEEIEDSFLDEEADKDDDMDTDDEEDDDDEEEEEIKPQKKTGKKELSKVLTPSSDKSEKKKKEQKETPKTPAQEKQNSQTPSKPLTPSGDGTESTKKKKKKKKNKNKQAETPGKPDHQNQQKQPEKQQKSGQTPHKKVLGGGVVMEEFNSGNGPVAQKGKMMHVYYVGKLQKDGKQFDSCTSGKPFKFRLGYKEVIPGWDKGLEGMKVGGKRRLIVPPKEGYGNQKQGPIPPNSTLVFDIELKSVS